MSLSSIIVVAFVSMTIFSETGVSAATTFDILIENWFNSLTSNQVCSTTGKVCQVSFYGSNFNLCKCSPSLTCTVDNKYCASNPQDPNCKLLQSELGFLFSSVGISRCTAPAPVTTPTPTTGNSDYST